ncbi:hypothetical protein AVEN_17572-1 [Araneus ventricosus]|uniref:Transposable element Tc1 transposase n=1 Tax=Araneus ventricosus TaxID=182803 RepID=A0A4Y2IZG5_ARAVE|nr:hypothetical protein AVEN_17572-1 [Araneus ventricosus]
MPLELWNSVLFVDESKYNVFGSDGKQMVWRKPNSELEMKILTPSVKHGGGSQMVLGYTSAVGVGNLHFIDGMMGKYMYLDILKQNLKQSAEKRAYCHITNSIRIMTQSTMLIFADSGLYITVPK